MAINDNHGKEDYMPIPDFQTLMLPILNFCKDQKEHTNRDLLDHLAEEFGLTESDRKELLPSGQQPTFDNRVAWARAHMKMAGLLENPSRGIFRITERGIAALKQKPNHINLKFLQQYQDYIEAKNRHKREKPDKMNKEEIQPQTPEEQIEEAYETLRAALANEILQLLKEATPFFFEKVVVEVIVKMGYGGSRKDAGQAIGKTGDEGIDGIINEDRLGLDIIYLQAKRWDASVGRPEIQKFAGALLGKKAKKGIFITTSEFTKEAREFAGMIESKIVLIDGEQLAQMMIDFNVGVTSTATYELKRIDSDYFTEE